MTLEPKISEARLRKTEARRQLRLLRCRCERWLELNVQSPKRVFDSDGLKYSNAGLPDDKQAALGEGVPARRRTSQLRSFGGRGCDKLEGKLTSYRSMYST